MIARREWYSLSVNNSINMDGTMATIEVDAEALEKLLRAIQCSIEPAVLACQYDKALDMIKSYKDMEEVLTALLSANNEEPTDE